MSDSSVKRLICLKSRRTKSRQAARTAPVSYTHLDLGVACGDGKGVIFARGEILKTVEEEAIAEEMIRMIQEGNFFSKV